MPSIGPQLPPHLQKRKRTPDDEGTPNSPRTKVTRRANEDEVALDDSDSDDDFGPSAPSRSNNGASSTSRPSIGPSLPPAQTETPTSAAQPKRSIGPALPPAGPPSDDDFDSDDDTGPAPPTAGPAPPPKRVLGPAPPPAPLSERPTTNPDSDSGSDSDSNYGPALPGSASSSRASHGPKPPSASSAEPVAPRRDDWMLAPPTSTGYRVTDTTKIKSRKFASGRSARDGSASGGVSSIWTETPEEKARRIADRVLGRGDGGGAFGASAGGGAGGAGSGNGSKEEDRERVQKYTAQTRGKSLYQEHQERKKDGAGQRSGRPGEGEEDDDPSKRAFDKEKDMGLGRISGSQRRELLNRSANFGDRFQSGKFL